MSVVGDLLLVGQAYDRGTPNLGHMFERSVDNRDAMAYCIEQTYDEQGFEGRSA